MNLAYLISAIVQVYVIAIFIYVLMSWIPNNGGIIGQIYSAMGTFCDPYLNLFKKFIPPIGGMIDISPMIAIIALQLLANFIINMLL